MINNCAEDNGPRKNLIREISLIKTELLSHRIVL